MLHHARETAALSALIHKLPARRQADLEAKFREVDPLTFAAGLREQAQNGRVLMINAAEDEVIPRACTEELARALGIERAGDLAARLGALHDLGGTAPRAANDGRLLRRGLAGRRGGECAAARRHRDGRAAGPGLPAASLDDRRRRAGCGPLSTCSTSKLQSVPRTAAAAA